MAAQKIKKTFSFECQGAGLAQDAFVVKKFWGQEAIAQLYEFRIVMASQQDFDPQDIMGRPAKFTIHTESGPDVFVHGLVSEFIETHNVGRWVFYEALLRPRMQYLDKTKYSRVFVDTTGPELFKALLDDWLQKGKDYEFKVQQNDELHEFLTQYQESNLNVINRWMEREGIYYFFEQSEEQETAIFTDSKICHTNFSPGAPLKYAPPAGFTPREEGERHILSFQCKHNLMPQKVLIKDYNYLHPSLNLEQAADACEFGHSTVYHYGYSFNTPEQGDRLAKIQAEAFCCQQVQYDAQSNSPFVRPGYTFEMSDHYKPRFNQSYLVVSIEHSGHQNGYFFSQVPGADRTDEAGLEYQNQFVAIPADSQFRLVSRTQRPPIHSVIHGMIDAANEGEFADMDEHGRYRVRLPFDLDKKGPGRASARLRMMQPYGGPNEGMHFPLRKGTEVAIVCMNGDPDRMHIAGTVPNPHCRSVVNDSNQTQSVIKTKSGHTISLEDKEGKKYQEYKAPDATMVRMGQHKGVDNLSINSGYMVYTENDQVELVKGMSIESVGPEPLKLNMSDMNARKIMYVQGDYNTTVTGDWKGEIQGEIHKKVLKNAHVSHSGAKAAYYAGAKWDTHGGAKGAIVGGDQTSINVGLKNSLVFLDDFSANIGGKNSFVLGEKTGLTALSDTGINLGMKNSIILGLKNSIAVGTDTSVNIGGKSSLALGAQMNAAMAAKIDLLLGPKIAALLGISINLLIGGSIKFIAGMTDLTINTAIIKHSIDPAISLSSGSLKISSYILDCKAVGIKTETVALINSKS